MRRHTILVIITMLVGCTSVFSQNSEKSVLKGHVLDSVTKEPLAYVNVFFSNTTLGDATDEDGYFEINNITNGSYDLIVNRIGYEIKTIALQFNKAITIEKDVLLESKPLSGEEIIVEAREYKDWVKDYNVFAREFLGESVNSKKCKILNPQVINFHYDSKNQDLVAQSDSIIHVENSSLGYNIDLVLVSFRYNEDYVNYDIYPRFTEMRSEEKKKQEFWIQNRKDIYFGSFKHFLSAFANNNIEEEKFEIFKGTIRESAEKKRIQVVTRGIRSLLKPTTVGLSDEQRQAGLKKIRFDDYLKVIYKENDKSGIEKYDEYFPTSFVLLNLDYALVDTFGTVYSPNAFKLFGFWADHRIADTLPLNYRPENNY